jgi:hypothetical protein
MGRNMGYLLHKEKTNGKQPQNSPLSPVWLFASRGSPEENRTAQPMESWQEINCCSISYCVLSSYHGQNSGLTLAKQGLNTWAKLPAFSSFSCFTNSVSHFFPRAGLRWRSSYFSCTAEISVMLHHERHVGWHGILLAFCPGWPWSMTLPISASWTAGIPGAHHYAQSKLFF